MTADWQDLTTRIEKWTADGRNPGTAHWHGALEATMTSFKPYLQPGCLTPVQPLEKGDYPLFEEVYIWLDLCPDLQAAYLPTAMGGVLRPPAALDSLRRVNPDNTSTLLLCRRPGPQPRILCAEISTEAWKPGVDLYEAGGLLGNYEYDSHMDCIRDLSKLVRTHMWRKEKWTAAHHRDYTLNWFSRVVETGRVEAPVQTDFSYVHQPVLLNLDRVSAVFELIHAWVAGQLQTARAMPGTRGGAVSQAAADGSDRQRFLEGRILALLDLLRDSGAVDFQDFSSGENEQFKDGFAAAVERLDRLWVAAGKQS